MGRRLALLIATYEYRDAGLRQLTAPAHDAEEFAAVLADPAIAGFEVTTLVNEPHHVVGQAIGDFYRDRRRDDLTLLYFTGHGLKDDDGRLYLAMADTARDNLLFTALSAEQVDRAMENCVSRQKVLVLDCCYSGAFPAGRIAKADTGVHSLERFRGRGRTVLTASDAIEYSFEGDHPHGEVRQSVFTRHLVAGLRNGSADLDGDGDITLDELYTYVHDRVVEEMPQQRPKKQDNVEGRTVIARNVNWTLPGYLRNAIKSPIAADRLAALEGLAHLSRIGNETVRSQVLEETRRLAEDDSKQVSAAAQALLGESDAVRDEPIARRDAEPARQPTPPVPASAAEPEPTQVVRQPVHDAPERPAEQAEQAPVIAPAQHAPRKPKPLRVSARPVWPRWVLKSAWLKVAAVLVVLVIGVVVTVQLFDEPGGGRGESPDTRPEAFAVLSNFTDEVHSVEFSSDGETLVTTSGTEIKLWDTAGQLITRTPEIPYFASTSDGGQVKISADGNTLATAPDGSTPQLWDVDTGQVTATFPSHQGWALKQFSPDGEILATAGTCVCEEDFDNPVQLWNTTSGELIRSLSGHVNGVQSMEFSPDGTTLAAGAAGGGPVRLWNVTTGVPTANLTAGFMLKFSPDGKILATSGEFTAEEKAQLWDVTTGKVIATLIEGDPIAFSPDGKTLLTANPRTSNPETTAAHLWQVPSGTIERSSASLVTTPMAFASDNKSLAIADTDGTVRLWDFTSGDTTHTFVGHTGLINDLAISPDGKTLATAGKDRTVRLWQLP